MEAEQRRAVAFAQRQQGFITQTLRLLVAYRRIQQSTKPADRRGDHYLPWRHLAGERTAELCSQAHRQQRVAAEGKEIGFDVVHRTAQQRRKRLRDGNFGCTFRCASAGFAGQLRQRQRLAIQFAVCA